MFYTYANTYGIGLFHVGDSIFSYSKLKLQTYKPELTVGDYAMFNCPPNYQSISDYQLEFRYLLFTGGSIANQVVVINRTPAKVLDDIHLSSLALVNKVRQKLGMPNFVREQEDNTEDDNKEPKYTEMTEGVAALVRILRKCPKVSVTKPKLCSVKQYISKERKRLKDTDKLTSRELLYQFDCIRANVEWLTNVLNFSDNNKLTEDWYYPVTQTQYNALCLMQSYTPHFRSCQYLNLHHLSKLELVRLYMHLEEENNNGMQGTLVMLSDNSMYELRQATDFANGVCDRFFQLDDVGYVNKRFAVYYDDNGKVSIDNFYNTRPTADLIIGNTEVSTDENFSTLWYKYESYKNHDNRALRVAKVMKQQ